MKREATCATRHFLLQDKQAGRCDEGSGTWSRSKHNRPLLRAAFGTARLSALHISQIQKRWVKGDWGRGEFKKRKFRHSIDLKFSWCSLFCHSSLLFWQGPQCLLASLSSSAQVARFCVILAFLKILPPHIRKAAPQFDQVAVICNSAELFCVKMHPMGGVFVIN